MSTRWKWVRGGVARSRWKDYALAAAFTAVALLLRLALAPTLASLQHVNSTPGAGSEFWIELPLATDGVEVTEYKPASATPAGERKNRSIQGSGQKS